MVVPRGRISLDLADLISPEIADQALAGETASAYRQLQPEPCQCLAAANSTLGNLFYSESRRIVAANSNDDCRISPAAAVQSSILGFQAIEERNESSATALELFYLLAQSEANRDSLGESLSEIERAIENLDQLRARGLESGISQSTLFGEKTNLLVQQTELELSVRRLNGQLQVLLGSEDPLPIWPEADLKVTAPVDVEQAVSNGLAMRADLGMLRMLKASLDEDTLSAVRSGFQSIDALLGNSSTGRCAIGGLSHRGSDADEVETRRRQLTNFLRDRELIVSEEIREAVYILDTRLLQIALAKQKRDTLQARLGLLKEKRSTGQVTASDVTQAQLDAIQAESELVHQVVAWKIAEVKLKRAQGLLAWECGYDPPRPIRYCD